MSELAASGFPRWLKLVMTVVLTVVVGPLVGTILVLLANAIGAVPDAIAMHMQGQPMMSLLFSGYLSGGVQALICGVVYALSGWSSGRLPIWVPIVTALILTLLFALALFGVSGGGIVFSMIIHIVPALATWWLVKAYWQRTEI